MPQIANRCLNNRNYSIIGRQIKNNSREFSKLMKRISAISPIEKETSVDIFKLAYSLGAFNNNQIDRQRACEFLFNRFDEKIDT